MQELENDDIRELLMAAVVAVLEVLDQVHLEKAKSMSNYSALR